MSALAFACAFIAAHEGCRLEAYQDSAGIWTIGYGHTGEGVTKGLVWSQTTADEQLAADIGEFAASVARLCKTSLSGQQAAALISFSFNLGVGALANSTLLEKVNASDFIAAAHEFPKWGHVGGTEVRGLLIRRFDEAALFLRGS